MGLAHILSGPGQSHFMITSSQILHTSYGYDV